MQRSSPLMFGHMVRGHLRDFRRCLAASSRGNRGASRGGSSGGRSGSGSEKSETAATSGPRASATSMVMSDAKHYARGPNTGAMERRINREDNMWHDRAHIDTKWLNPHDPLAYRPNFRQTEPTMLRKQFMRSPDEVSREVLGRDWEEAVKSFRRKAMRIATDGSRKSGWEQDQGKQEQQQTQQQSHQQQQPKHPQIPYWGMKPTQDES